MKPTKDPFYKKRKAAMEGLRSLVWQAIASLGFKQFDYRVNVAIGRPAATRVFSSATGTVLVYLSIPRNWRLSVHDEGLAALDSCLCLHAQRAPKPVSNVDGCWRVLLFSPGNGWTRHQMAVKFAGVVRTADTGIGAYQACLNVFREALLGEET